jgi:hypothetical protein
MPANHVTLAEELAEQALKAYHAVAYHDDNAIAGGWTETYRNAVKMIKACITHAYGSTLKAHGADAEDVYNLTIDSGESVAYCVKWACEHPEDLPFRI